jgi:hypothetical protein
MNKPTNEMALEKCDCSTKCLCTRSHEQFCDGSNCNCWCHRPPPPWKVMVMEALYRAIKGDKAEKED